MKFADLLLEDTLEGYAARRIEFTRLPTPETQHLAVPGRKFRADFAWPAQRVILEVHGAFGAGGHAGGHRGIAGWRRDLEKLSLCAAHGWRVVCADSKHVKSGEALEWVKAALAYSPASESHEE